jgi:hypothetical protein
MNGATYVEDSGNRKIMGSKKIDATYVSIEASCPKSCPLKGEGCYAELGYTGYTTHRLDDEAEGFTAIQAARAECSVIDSAYNGGQIPKGRDLRLHISGDSRTITGTRIINAAIARWKNRGGGSCWSYTHAFSHVPRKDWSNVSVLASIDNVGQVEEARKQGYACAILVSEHPSEKAYRLPGSDVKWIPCPQQTRSIGCADCRLCFNSERLFESNMGIAFAAHGVMKNQIKRHLTLVK